MKLGIPERATIDCMMNIYSTTLMDNSDRISRCTACAMLKQFFTYLDRKHCLEDNESQYILSFDIMSGPAGHKAFYDIIDRWVSKTPVNGEE